MSRLRMEDLLQPRILIEFAADNIWETLPQYLLALGIFFGGLLIILLIKWLLAWWWLPKKYRETYRLFEELDTDGNAKRKVYLKTTQRSWTSIAHIILETFFFVTLVIVIWISAHVAGFDFWHSSLVGVGLGLVGTYIFGTPLTMIGSSYFVYIFNLVREGIYIRINNKEGRVVELHPLGAQLESVDPKTGGAVDTHIPMTWFLMYAWHRLYYEEKMMPSTTRDPNQNDFEKVTDDVRIKMEEEDPSRKAPAQYKEYYVGKRARMPPLLKKKI